ncbi:hypothetical protein ACFL5V_06350 [Fibrobacterota bacterium]
MKMNFSAEEIFQIGIEIEKNGKHFYESAANVEQDEDMKKLFAELSSWESGHVEIFEDLKKGLQDQKQDDMTNDIEDQYYRYLKAMADDHVFIINNDVLDLITTCEDSVDVLKMALRFEKDSVVLYAAMKKVVPEHLGRDMIDNLINEEISHVAMISEKIKGMKNKA